MTDGRGLLYKVPAEPINVTIYADGFGRFLQRLYLKRTKRCRCGLLDRDGIGLWLKPI